jgi:AcrR family transcriptional regulator
MALVENNKVRMNKEDRRKQILQSALNVFVENGYNKTTTKGIASAAKISEVTLFRYFESKAEIFTRAIEPILISTLEKAIDDAKALNPVERLKYILKQRLKIILENEKLIKLVLMESNINPELSNVNYIDKTVLLLKEEIKQIGFDHEAYEFVIRLMMGSILSFLYLPVSDEKMIENYVDEIIDILLKKKQAESRKN